jgi:hypothetical protein
MIWVAGYLIFGVLWAAAAYFTIGADISPNISGRVILALFLGLIWPISILVLIMYECDML